MHTSGEAIVVPKRGFSACVAVTGWLVCRWAEQGGWAKTVAFRCKLMMKGENAGMSDSQCGFVKNKMANKLISMYYQGNKFGAKGEAVVVISGILQDLIKIGKEY